MLAACRDPVCAPTPGRVCGLSLVAVCVRDAMFCSAAPARGDCNGKLGFAVRPPVRNQCETQSETQCETPSEVYLYYKLKNNRW